MIIMLLGAVRRLFWLTVLLAAVAAAYWFRDDLRPLVQAGRARWETLRGRTPAAGPALPSAELAAAAERKIDALRAGETAQASFTDLELQSLLEYRYAELFPAFVDSPRVTLEGDRLRLRVRVPTERLPQVRELGDVAAILPDTTDLDVRGQLLPAEDGHVAFAVDAVSANRIPLPGRLVPPALELLGRTDRPGLRQDAILLPLPKGARAAYVRRDSLVLLAR